MNPTNSVRALKARPVALLAALVVLASLGNVLLVGCGGGGSDSGSGGTTTNTGGTDGGTDGGHSDGGTDGGSDGATAGGPADGAKIYADRCALCHGAGGKGDGPASAALDPKPRNHTDGSYMNAQTQESLLEVIRDGKGAMPPWGSVLSDEEINAVLDHVRSLAEPPYSG